MRTHPSRCGCEPGKPLIRNSILPCGSTGGASAGATSCLPVAEVVIAETDGTMIGFVTVDPRTFYLDQIVVAPEYWRSGVGATLIAEAKLMSPAGLDLDVNIDNVRAIGFYRRLGFLITGAGENPISGKPVHRMSWRP